MIDYKLVYCKRKTVGIYIRDRDEVYVEVRAPLKMPKKEVDKVVALKEKWIREHINKTLTRAEMRGSFTLTYGDSVTYMGKKYPIMAKDGDRVGFDYECFYIPPDLCDREVKEACVAIYRLLAKKDLTKKAFDFGAQMSVTPNSIKINSANCRWGSCSSKKNINFSWRLIMADEDVVDYVVVHELAHIIELNHSERFWAIVGSILPDYKERQRMLKELQKRLCEEDWGI
jgi:predicted metal-dependent hydrolase